jgi:hypothetical protein
MRHYRFSAQSEYLKFSRAGKDLHENIPRLLSRLRVHEEAPVKSKTPAPVSRNGRLNVFALLAGVRNGPSGPDASF